MLVVFLLFLTIPVVSSADPKCPKGFNHFKRVPTVKNNHTKDWCLGVFKYENMGDRDRARSVCIHHDAMLSIPENRKEFDAISNMVKKQNLSDPHAIDGEITPKCKAHIFQLKNKYLDVPSKQFNWNTEKGECNVKKHLFQFDDSNTDPSFILTKFSKYSTDPTPHESDRFIGEPLFQKIGECMMLIRTNYTGNQTDYSMVETAYCNTGPRFFNMKINSVVCGRHPL